MRGRGGPRSKASLTVVTDQADPATQPAVLPGNRPPPPDELTTLEAAEWHAIVERMPPDWFPVETWPVLKELCRNIILSNRVARELARFGDGSLGGKRFAKFRQLTRM